MTGDPVGATAFIRADFREPGKILADPALRATLDLAWRPEGGAPEDPRAAYIYAAMGRKP